MSQFNYESNYSKKMRDVLVLAKEEAFRINHDPTIRSEDLLLAIIREAENVAVKILRNLNVDTYKLKKAIEDQTRRSGHTTQTTQITYSKEADKILKIMVLEAKLYRSNILGTEHLLLSILRDEDNIAAQILGQFGVTYDNVKGELDKLISDKCCNEPNKCEDEVCINVKKENDEQKFIHAKTAYKIANEKSGSNVNLVLNEIFTMIEHEAQRGKYETNIDRSLFKNVIDDSKGILIKYGYKITSYSDGVTISWKNSNLYWS